MAEAKFQIPEDGVLVNVDPAFGLGLTRKEAAKRLGLSVETLRHMEDLGIGPRVIRLTPRKAFYPEDDLADWVASRAKGGRFVTQLVSPWSQLTSPRRQDTDARGFLYVAASGRLSPYGRCPSAIHCR
jgi:predicted DNA-binding transcriptional regulator AlpA